MAHTLEPGAIFDHGRQPTEELAADVIRLAIERGWQDAEAAGFVDLLADTDSPWEVEVSPAYTLSEALQDAAFDASSSAEEYLQNHHCPPGYWIGNDGDAGAFGVWLHAVYVVELAETVTRDDDGQTVEGSHGVMSGDYEPRDYIPMDGITGDAARAILDAAAELVDVDDLLTYGAFDSVDEREGETIAYLADLPDVGDDVPYVRAIAIRHPRALERDAVRTVLDGGRWSY